MAVCSMLLRRLRCFFLVWLLPVAASAQWVEPPGNGWIQISLYHHDTMQRFDVDRKIAPLFNEAAHSITTSLFVTAVVGLYRGLDVWGQVPVHRLQFNDVAASRQSFGLGDPRIHLRIGPSLFGLDLPVPIAVRGGVKWPVGDFPVDAEIVPLTEGQPDWELMLELGHSFYPWPLYASGWIGYRWRTTNHDIDRKPGNERFGYFALGGLLGKFTWKAGLEAIIGEKWISFTGVRIPLSKSQRELIQFMPTIGWQLPVGTIEIGGRWPIAGRNLPAGPALTMGYFYRWKSR